MTRTVKESTPIQESPFTSYYDNIITKIGYKTGDIIPPTLYQLLNIAHGRVIKLENGEDFFTENTSGFLAKLGNWYEQQDDNDLAARRLTQSLVVFYDGKSIGKTNQIFGPVAGDTVIAAHHYSFKNDQASPYQTINCSLGGDEGFALIIPTTDTNIDVNSVINQVNEKTQAIEQKWLESTLTKTRTPPKQLWEKNWHIAPLRTLTIDLETTTKMRRASDGAALIESIVDSVKKYKPGNQTPEPALTQTIVDTLINRAKSAIFAVEPNQSLQTPTNPPLLPSKVIQLEHEVMSNLEAHHATKSQKDIVQALAKRAPYSELFAHQQVLEKPEFIGVVANIAHRNQSVESDERSLEWTLSHAERSPFDAAGKPRKWQLGVISSRYAKEANSQGRLLGTKELWMVTDAVHNSLSDSDLHRRSCVGKSGGSFIMLVYASDHESSQIMQNIYQQEIISRNRKHNNTVTNPLDLHITTSFHDLTPVSDDKDIQAHLDQALDTHYKLETWQALAQTNLFTQLPKFIFERFSRRAPHALDILWILLTNIADHKLLSQANNAIQSGRSAFRSLGLTLSNQPKTTLAIRAMTILNRKKHHRNNFHISREYD